MVQRFQIRKYKRTMDTNFHWYKGGDARVIRRDLLRVIALYENALFIIRDYPVGIDEINRTSGLRYCVSKASEALSKKADALAGRIYAHI